MQPMNNQLHWAVAVPAATNVAVATAAVQSALALQITNTIAAGIL